MTLEAATTDPLAPAAPVAADPLAPAAPAAPAADAAPTAEDLAFLIEDDDLAEAIPATLASIPGTIRIALLKTAVRGYVHNRVSTAKAKAKKANEAWGLYDAAMAADPLQQAVAKPTTDKVVTDVAGIVNGALTALYTGKLGRKGDGTKKQKALRDPIDTQVTRAVVAELYKKMRETDPSVKYPTVQKLVGASGIAYLKAKMAEKVAAGADAASMDKILENQYLKPARIMLGLEKVKSLADAGSIL